MASLAPGDTLFLRGGSYPNAYLHGSSSGLSNAPISVKAFENEIPIITGDPTYEVFLNVFGEWWVIDGLHVEKTPANTSAQVNLQGKHHRLRNLTLKENLGSNMIRVLNASDVLIEKCSFDTTGGDLSPSNAGSGQGQGDHIYVMASDRVLIQDNYFTKAGHAAIDVINGGNPADASFAPSHDVVIRRNKIEQHWGGGIYVSRGSYRTLVEDNEIYFAGEQVTSYPKAGLQVAAESGIWRRNRIGWSSVSPVADTGITIAAYYYGGIHQNVRNNRIYNNVVYKTGFMPVMFIQKDTSLATQNKVLNNIFYYCRLAGNKNPYWPDGDVYLGFDIYHAETQWTDFPNDNYFHNNIFLHADANGDHPANPRMIYYQSRQVTDYAYSLIQAESQFPEHFKNNQELNPKFVNADQRDFRLSADSLAINAGMPLARASGSGSGNTVPVDDPYCFSDGYGMIEGDQVQVGSTVARVTKVDVPTKQLSLDASVSFTSGTPVSLPYKGSAPDMGVFEFESAAPIPPTPTPPTLVRKVNWPTGEAKQNAIIELQWRDRYRFKRHLSGAYAEFERVPE